MTRDTTSNRTKRSGLLRVARRLTLGVGTPLLALAFLAGSSAPDTSGPTKPRPGVFLRHQPLLPLRDTPATLAEINPFLRSGDSSRALFLAEELVAHRKWGRDRNAAWFAIGMLERDAYRHNRASEAFTRVRAVTSPLAELAAYHEAEQDLLRGRPWVARRECERYQEAYPQGRHLDACERLTIKALIDIGRTGEARERAEAYDDEHPNAPIGEHALLREAQAAEQQGRPATAIQIYRDLSIEHSAALHGRLAEERLAAMLAEGHEDARIPDESWARRKRAQSLRDSGRIEAAWQLYTQIAEDAAEGSEDAAWAKASLEVFALRTRHYDPWIAVLEAEFEETPSGELAADLMRILGRAGRWQEAAAYGTIGMRDYARTRSFSRKEEVVGRTMMLGGDYAAAVQTFDKLAGRGGWRGRRGRYLAAFARLMNEQFEEAAESFATVIEKDAYRRANAHYWRARALESLGRSDEANVHRKWLESERIETWYGVLSRSQTDVSHPPWAERKGAWGYEVPVSFESAHVPPPSVLVPVVSSATPAWRPVVRGAESFSLVSWPFEPAPSPNRGETLLLRNPLEPPASYAESPLFRASRAEKALESLHRKHGEAFPEIGTALELARVGLYDYSGPIFSAFFEDYKDARRSSRHPRHAAARALYLPDEEWRELFLFTRDHHHVARYLHGLDEGVSDPTLREEALRLGWPLAHDLHVWSHAEAHNIDPFLALGLMRAESTYNAIAVSRVGARGAMQIMPKTGHLLAETTRDEQFTAGDLEDPTRSVSMGIRYLGLLQKRFGGVFPLSVAAYNAGPHNVSSWLQGTGLDLPIDAWVEHIPYKETRRYVRRVSANYATYTRLYGAPDAIVVPPRTPLMDDPTIVNF